eukprot:TRINITY_DN5519_c0_g1_i1.p2 TRINITY_DN5519_c0_g1~~TRINITY_DN5519_c0_g1_i1.p2  ORF type:complete len:324 (+),score=39.70 TRINITY_DN5519_c0_g1_i1:71-973(+)
MEGDEEGFSTDGEGQYLMAASSLGSQISPGGETLRDVGVVSTRTYVLRLRDEVLMRCSMNQSIGVVKPGSSIFGVMDFRKGEEESESVGARVRQVVLSLETEESVQSDHLVNNRQSQGSLVRCLYEEQQFVVQDVQTLGGETLRDVGVVSTRTYVLRLRDEVLMRCSMNQSIGVVKPGSSISGVMDFRKGEEESESVGARVRQVVLSLETEESVQSDHLVNNRQSQGSLVRCLYEEQQFVVQDVQTLGFTLSVPPLAPPSFSTQVVNHKWFLRFELVALTENKRQTEVTLWKLPLQVQSL